MPIPLKDLDQIAMMIDRDGEREITIASWTVLQMIAEIKGSRAEIKAWRSKTEEPLPRSGEDR